MQVLFSPLLPDLRKNIIFFKVPMLLPVVLQGQNVDKDECGILIERCGQGKTEVLGELCVPLPLCPSFSSYRAVSTPLSLYKSSS
jgi:hypothetical protein